MKSAVQTLKILWQSPLGTLSGIGRRILYRFRVPAQVVRLRRIARDAPFILQIETVNACNAACIFCAYPGMTRKKGVMTPALFEKVVQEYAAMGGGPVSLTPVVGDALLDPHLMERLGILERYPAINQVTMTTNAIALDRYGDEEVRRLLSRLYCIQISIGGLDAATYETMYGIDRFAQVREAMDRLVRLRETVARPAQITFAFRTNDWKFEERFRPLLDDYRRQGVFTSHMWAFMNYAGAVKADEEAKLVVVRSRSRKRLTCVSPSMSMAVCWDGTITACGCADFNGNMLTIGDAGRDTMAGVWRGKKRAAILDSFPEGRLFPICRGCSAYTPDTVFASSFFDGIDPHRPLPLDFFHNMMT